MKFVKNITRIIDASASLPVQDILTAIATPAAVPSPARDLQRRLEGHYNAQGELIAKAHFARALGSEFVARVLEASFRQLDHGPQTAAMVRNWGGDPAAAALAMRFNAALHLLARRGTPSALAALYAHKHNDFDGAIAEALASQDELIAEALRHPTQTNEVGRAAAIVAALIVAQEQLGAMPFELFELGSSCGLNLNLGRYAYNLGGIPAGDPDSPVKIAPEWRGAAAPRGKMEIMSACGVDLHPLDARDPATIEQQLAYVWADDQSRVQRLEHALELAREYPPRVEPADALSWLGRQLQMPQAEGVCRTLFHSMVLQYFKPEDRDAVVRTIRAAGERASDRHPLAWISFEWSRARDEVRLHLTCWPKGETRCLAVCHPYGAWIDWHGVPGMPGKMLRF